MAINLITEFPGKIDSGDPNYPLGKARNITVTGDGTGTPWHELVANDIFGFQQALIEASGVVISGVPDNAFTSDYLDAVQEIIDTRVLSTITGSGVLSGFIVENEGSDPLNDIQFNPGSALDTTGTTFINLETPIIKQIDSIFSVGTNQGGLFVGAVAANTSYHLFAIKRDSDGLIDAGFDIDPAGGNIPAGWSTFQRVASLKTTSLSQLYQFKQIENNFFLDGFQTISSGPAVIGDQTRLFDSLVPRGDLDLIAFINVGLRNNEGTSVGWISGTQQSNILPLLTGIKDYAVENQVPATPPRMYLNVEKNVPIQNTIGEFRLRTVTSIVSGNTEFITLRGWIDHRN